MSATLLTPKQFFDEIFALPSAKAFVRVRFTAKEVMVPFRPAKVKGETVTIHPPRRFDDRQDR